MTTKRTGALRLAAWMLLALGLLARTRAGTSAQGPDQVAVVVQYADGSVSTHCVALDAAQTTGLEALQRTGLDVVYQGGALGARVCKIGPVGCDLPGDCFCQCKGQECLYWSYWHLVDGAWQYAVVGAASYQVAPGSVEGWSWGIGTPNRAPQPPPASFEEVCAPPTARPTGTVGATATPSPTTTPTDTLSPTPTVRPTGTVRPTATVTSTPTRLPAAEQPPSPTPTQPAPTPTPGPAPAQATADRPTETPIPVPTPAPTGPESTNYIFFGAIVLVLLALGAYVLLRRR